MSTTPGLRAPEKASTTTIDPIETLQRLRQIGNMKFGDPMPDWLSLFNDWGTALSKLCRDAAELLERALP